MKIVVISFYFVEILAARGSDCLKFEISGRTGLMGS